VAAVALAILPVLAVLVAAALVLRLTATGRLGLQIRAVVVAAVAGLVALGSAAAVVLV
jgi:hypothetical protein